MPNAKYAILIVVSLAAVVMINACTATQQKCGDRICDAGEQTNWVGE